MSGMTTLDSGLIVNGVPVGGAMIGNSYFVCPTATTAYRTLMWERYEDTRYDIDNSVKLHTTIADAYDATTSGRNDTIYVVPSTYVHTAVLTWSNSNTNMIGLHASSPWANNVLLQHNSGSAVSPVWDITGDDNYFANIHFQDAGSDGNQHINVRVKGNGNTFENCWFEGSCNATQADDTAYSTVMVDGASAWRGQNHFKNCLFGSTAQPMNGQSLLGFESYACENTFENCTFFSFIDGAAAVMIDNDTANDIQGVQFFKGCTFTARSSNWATKGNYLIRGLSANAGGMVFDPLCMAVGFSYIGESDLVATNPYFFGLQYSHSASTVDQTIAGLVIHSTKS